jgi:hypothetical protein
LAEIQSMVDTLHSGKGTTTRPMDSVAARQLCCDIFGNYTQVLASAGFVTSLPLRTRAELTDLLEYLPTPGSRRRPRQAPWLAPARVTLDLCDFWYGHHQVTVEVQPDEVRPADP